MFVSKKKFDEFFILKKQVKELENEQYRLRKLLCGAANSLKNISESLDAFTSADRK